jgi:hypothetical protein
MKIIEHLEYINYSDSKDTLVLIYTSILMKIFAIKKYYYINYFSMKIN